MPTRHKSEILLVSGINLDYLLEPPVSPRDVEIVPAERKENIAPKLHKDSEADDSEESDFEEDLGLRCLDSSKPLWDSKMLQKTLGIGPSKVQLSSGSKNSFHEAKKVAVAAFLTSWDDTKVH